jgi:polysaccharide export outer membrane protein
MTRMFARATLVGFAFSLFFASDLGAQQRGMPAAGNRSEIMNRLRSVMESTGMTPEQIRSRLKAQGYPESMLDSYMPGARGVDTLALPEPDVFEAVRALGLADSAAVDTLRNLTKAQRVTRQRMDSAFIDSVVAALRTDTTEDTREALRVLLRTKVAERSVADSGFEQFGRALFDRESSEFDPNLTATVGPDYALGPGDRLVLILTGETEKAYDLEVTRQGFVVIPGVGQVSVANLTLGQLEDHLYTVLRRVYSGVRRGEGATTRFSINVARSGANQIHVTGDVERPGAYQVSRAGSALTALYLAGGPTRSGSMRSVQVRRAGALVGEIDLYDYALQGSTRSIALRSGDILFVPPRGAQVRIAGAVLRPATYELRREETLADLIRMAGGFRPEADRRFVQIDRIVPAEERATVGAGRRLVEVASDLFRSSSGPAEPLLAGDIVRVLSIPIRSTGRIAVLGNVWQPGPVAFTPGMQLSDALARAGGVKPDSYLREVIISRLRPDSSREMITASLRDTSGATESQIVLADADEIRVFSLTDLRVPTYVTISGAVREPGRVPYREGMTLRQLILLAGGLEESALLTEAEVARIPPHRPTGVLAETQRVPLDSTYIFGRGSGTRFVGAPGVPTQPNGAAEFVLQPYDAVLIMQQPGWELQQMVTVTGEVKNPGQYAIRNRGERLADIVARAGGVTANGYSGGIVFIRKRDRVGRIGLNLPAVLRNKRHSDNILLVDRDSIFIPRYEPVVRVRGAVNSPVAVAYVAGQNLDYYINAAGGATSKADKKRAFVTQANGKVQSRSSYLHLISWVPKPQPGSVVVVPEEDPTTGLNLSSVISNTVSLVTAIVAVIAISR